MIERYVIERVESLPIESVAARLGLRVERHKALCPWHEDRHPSLTFNTYRNRYRCYVCEAHGGVIDMVQGIRGCGFREAVEWLTGGQTLCTSALVQRSIVKPRRDYPPDIEWLGSIVRTKVLNEEARRFLYDERKIDPRVVAWCGLTSISTPTPCWRYGRPFYDAPSLLIPYYNAEGHLQSVQSRYLKPAAGDIPRFRFPRGSNCHVYGLQILPMLRPDEELWITEGASDCWAMLSSGRKAIAIPSATLLKDKDIEPLRGLNLHMYPDRDAPGERLFLDLRERLPQIVRHELPNGCKDFGDYYQIITTKNKIA
ncbi:MAG: CHC2 zinc finger domain-containing protein [Paludibacteraceae bacterium]